MIYETFREAVQNIWSNKFRTFLTMLGIIIGVTAVIVIVGLGNGMTQSIASSFADLGTNIISVQVMGYGSRSVEVEDVYSLVDARPDLLEAVSPPASITGTVKVGPTSYSNPRHQDPADLHHQLCGSDRPQEDLRCGRLYQPCGLWRQCRGPDHQDRLGKIYDCGRTGSQGDRHLGSGGQQR